MAMNWFSGQMTFPAAQPPEWHARVDRWYQLDAAAYVLSETFWRHRVDLNTRPDWLLLASPGASNATDFQFTCGAPSPSKFVHTLPNMRSAALLQLMEWSGRVLCVQNDPSTVVSALSEALLLGQNAEEVWVATCRAAAAATYSADIFVLRPGLGSLKIGKIAARAHSPMHDKDLFRWLNSSAQDAHFFIAGDFAIMKSERES